MLDASQISRRIKLRQLNVFIAVVQCGSMAKAAEQLAISQPVISKTIAELEQILGLPVLERSRLGVQPTLYGRALLGRSIALCNIKEPAWTSCSRWQTQHRANCASEVPSR